jgi:hypothetical protein
MSADRFVGTWRLVYCEHVYPDGEAINPLGPTPRARITYTADGRVRALVGAAIVGIIQEAARQVALGRQRPALPPPEAATGDLLLTGRYQATETHLTHHIETSPWPARDGTSSRRAYVFSKDRLIVSIADAPLPGVLSFLWERAEASD